MINGNAPATYFSSTRPEILPLVPASRRRVLEIGCGEGRFVSSVPGVEETWGVEPSPAAKEAGKRLTRVFEATFDEAKPDLPLAYFDVVVCNDVIEHLPDHESFLRTIRRHIAPDGVLVGSIPNVRYYRNLFQLVLEKDWHYTDHGILDRTHTAFFTEKSLRKTLERCGYTVALMQGINEWSPGTPRDYIYRATAHVLRAATGGYFADIMPLQFAFRAVPKAAD